MKDLKPVSLFSPEADACDSAPQGVPIEHEWRLWQQGYRLVAGVDEAGRGALAGPVVAAAVVMPAGVVVSGVRDSKAVPPDARSELCAAIIAAAEAVGIGVVEAEGIDDLNILRATHQAMAAALARLAPEPDYALIDGRPVDGIPVPHYCLVKGDQRSFLIAAASIVAKVTRDSIMLELDGCFPGYGFADHKGYGTASHCRALAQHGPCPAHRRSFEPVARLLRPSLPGLTCPPE